MESEWQITVSGQLQAAFRQPDGRTQAGTDWALLLSRGAEEHRVLVRSYAEDVCGLESEQEIALVLKYVECLLGEGWNPDNCRHWSCPLTECTQVSLRRTVDQSWNQARSLRSKPTARIAMLSFRKC